MANEEHLKGQARISALEMLVKTLMADILAAHPPEKQKEQLNILVETMKEGTPVQMAGPDDPSANPAFHKLSVDAMQNLTAEIGELANVLRSKRS